MGQSKEEVIEVLIASFESQAEAALRMLIGKNEQVEVYLKIKGYSPSRRRIIRPATAQEIRKVIPLMSDPGHVNILDLLAEKDGKPVTGREMSKITCYTTCPVDKLNARLHYCDIVNLALRRVDHGRKRGWSDKSFQMFVVVSARE